MVVLLALNVLIASQSAQLRVRSTNAQTIAPTRNDFPKHRFGGAFYSKNLSHSKPSTSAFFAVSHFPVPRPFNLMCAISAIPRFSTPILPEPQTGLTNSVNGLMLDKYFSEIIFSAFTRQKTVNTIFLICIRYMLHAPLPICNVISGIGHYVDLNERIINKPSIAIPFNQFSNSQHFSVLPFFFHSKNLVHSNPRTAAIFFAVSTGNFCPLFR